MANASAEIITKTTVTLEMTGEEASAVVAVLRKVGGYPEDTRRGYTANVLDALHNAGIESAAGDLVGGLRFAPVEGLNTGRVR